MSETRRDVPERIICANRVFVSAVAGWIYIYIYIYIILLYTAVLNPKRIAVVHYVCVYNVPEYVSIYLYRGIASDRCYLLYTCIL